MSAADQEQPPRAILDDPPDTRHESAFTGVSGVNEVRMYIFDHNGRFPARSGNGAIQ
jgi:hypothetical protein